MSRRLFPKTLFVTRHVDGKTKAFTFSTAPRASEIVVERDPIGELVGVYELASVEQRIHVTRTIGEKRRRG